MVTLNELFTPKTKTAVLESALKVAQQIGLPITAWQPLEPGREIIEIISSLISMYTEIGFQAASSKLLSYAKGQWLTLTAKEDYDTDRDEATFGTATVRLTNTTNIAYPIAADDLHLLNSETGSTYTNTTGGTLAAYPGFGTIPTLDLEIIADVAGTESNAAVGAINEFVTPLTGVTVTNLTALVGNDDETDENLVTKCREGNARLSPNGPKDAYSYFAKTTKRPDGTSVGVTRVRNHQPYANRGTVIVFIASASGYVPGSNTDWSTDVGLVQRNILENVEPTGFIATVVSASPVTISPAATIYLRSGSTADPAAIKSQVVERLAAYFSRVPIGGVELVQGGGGYVFLSAIIDQIFDVNQEEIVQVVITNMASDVSLAISQVPTSGSTIADFNIVYAAS